MKKSQTIIIGVVVVVIVIVGGYAIFHKSSKPTASATSSSQKSSTATVNNAVLTTKTSSSLGNYLATPSGAPLYTYSGDSSGVSNVSGSLLASWPAYQVTSSTSSLPTGVSTIKRTDNGETQYTYNGMPLYTFVSDTNGQPTGDGVGGFNIAKPAVSSPSQTTTAPSSSNNSSNPY